MTRSQEFEPILKERVVLTEKAAAVLSRAAGEVRTAQAMGVLRGANTYLYAAMLADFVRDTSRGDWIGPEVRMGDGSVKATDDAVLDHIFGEIFKPILSQGPDAEVYLMAVREKAERIVASRKRVEVLA